MDDCGCRREIIKRSCGCWNEDSVLTVKCGRRLSKTNRKLFCEGVEVHTTYSTECCSASVCQVKRFPDKRWRCCRCGNDNHKHYICSVWPDCGHRCCHRCTRSTLHDVVQGAGPDNLQGLSVASGAAAANFSNVKWMAPASNAGAATQHSIQQEKSSARAGAAAFTSPLPIRPTPRRAAAPSESLLAYTSKQVGASCGYQGMAAPNAGVVPGYPRGRSSPLPETRATQNPSTRLGWVTGAALNDLHGYSGQRTVSGPALGRLQGTIPSTAPSAAANSSRRERPSSGSRSYPPGPTDMLKWGVRKRRT